MKQVADFAERVLKNVSRVIVGKDEVIKKILAAFLSSAHVLINDVPGVGKTMLARSFAISLGLNFSRVQCTPDLTPSDITGFNVLDPRTGQFSFKKGVLFTDVLLVDEINRATPRTQSALLQAMAEKQVSIDGVTYQLSEHFFVIATQNPVEFEGTFPLPEAQLDRFAICLSLGYLERDQEIELLRRLERSHPIESLEPVCEAGELSRMKELVKEVYVDDSVMDYAVRIVARTRTHPDVALGSSPRGSIALVHLSRALAAMSERNFVLPDDVKSIALDVLAHRLILKPEARLMRKTKQEIVEEILNSEEAPIRG
ncbi:magnesium chelatase [Pseudothermotoga hypogea DSM 11164 = NBRC 106472]|uniref:Magnesium chelatase n=2 Tax=Pseudothermotoga TaxID=1643951 RepID=A0A0X1KQF2_9THEM|nr:MoxR family ATPase [Pseudothermotoga hypogea]AJC73483.1 magnesium chelatase [Pseudothermotoga hypogea DSM 11164 = NBRC 106472]MBC7122873.1 MoxR family ATPase [Pseudothermotoga sp.]